MKTTIQILALLAILGFTQCKRQKEASTIVSNEVKIEIPDLPKNKTPLVVDRSYKPRKTAPYDILSTELDGDILTVVVSYSGGCEEHNFTLISNEMYTKSMPPKLPLYLEHEANGDACRALIQETLTFDISGARYMGSKVVRLLLNGSMDNEVVYEYPDKK